MELILQKIWNDPVWSKVISAVIILAAGFFVSILPAAWLEGFVSLIKYELNVPIWATALIIIVISTSMYFMLRKKDSPELEGLTSKEWFSEIDKQIKDCSFARIYLRDFAHPDQFKSEHRESLLAFMRSLAERLEAGADIRIIAYRTSLSGKSGFDWLNSEITSNREALKKIKLITVQPTSNASSMYLFDSGIVLYNRRAKNSHTYHIENLQGSIVHFLIRRGFSESQGELQ